MRSPLDEVLEALQALLDAQGEAPVPSAAGEGNFRCENCVDCAMCRFCSDCSACEDCTYCERCDGCNGCTHCQDCERCTACTHSRWSAGCTESSYVTLCLDCDNCVQCFACVGLSGGEFCILNEKLPRKAYFSRVATLRAALEERMSRGWQPPWTAAPEPEPEPEPEVEPEPEPEYAEAPDADALAVEVPAHGGEPASPPMTDLAGPRPGRGDVTIDTGHPAENPASPPVETPPWTFPDPRGSRREPSHDEDARAERVAAERLPEPPPYGTGPVAEEGSVPPLDREARGVDESGALNERPRDRYGWSAQAEDTASSVDWPRPEGTSSRRAGHRAIPERRARGPRSDLGSDSRARSDQRMRDTRDGLSPAEYRGLASEPVGKRSERGLGGERRGYRSERSYDEPRRPRPERRSLATRDEAAPREREPLVDPGREARAELDWPSPPPSSRLDDDRAQDLKWRRRETAASPLPPESDPDELLEGLEVDPRPASPRGLDAWSPYDQARRAELGPDEQTEPDAPVARRGQARAEISGAASASPQAEPDEADAGTSNPPPRESTLWDEPPGASGPAEPRATGTSGLGRGRRPERPRPPENTRGGGLRRGRAPARPQPAPPRQNDAPSLRRARRPVRSKEDVQTSPYPSPEGSSPDAESESST
ncbi:MAG: hypothetical protein AAF799_23540 [Myxococcota bacterium]